MTQALRDSPPEIIISDNSMPSFDARAALALLHATGLDIPFIVVSGQIGEESAAALMRAGAHDFVLKDNLTRLAPAVQRELTEVQERRKRRRAEAALRSTEDRFRLVAEHLKDVVFRYRLGATPRLEYISSAATALTGHSPEQLQSDVELLFAAVDPADRDVLLRSWQSPPEQPLTVRWRLPDGSPAWIEQRLVLVLVDDAAVGEGVLRDITEQVLDARRREELEHQLHQAERLDSLGQLAGGIAHDFNNLLGVISGYVRFVLDDLGEDHPSRQDIENIDHAAGRAAALTRQLLIFSRLQPSQPEVVDLNAVVAEIERLLRRTIGEDIDFRIEVRPTLPPVFIDRSRLEQIVMNLVVNARAAMPGGGRLTLATGTDDDRHVCLTVSDTGCGMTEEVKRRAFEPFFTTRGRGQGSGLGLSTVYGAVTEASGVIVLDSRVGEGTSITVRLPAAVHSAAAQPSGDDDESDLRGDGERILIVEDDDGIRQIACRILSGAGYSVLDTAIRSQALELVRDTGQAFDLLLSDVVMPGMPVTEFLDAVRDARPSMPILLMSGYTADQTANSRPLPDSIPLVTKPFKLATLLRRVKGVLETHRVHTSARR